MFGFHNKQFVGAAGVQAHVHFRGGEGEVMVFGKCLCALIGGFEHGHQSDVEMKAANAQNKDACGEEVGFFCKHGGTVAIEVVAFGRNQCGERADLWNQGLADKA